MSECTKEDNRITLMFVVKCFERNNALPVTIRALNDRAIAQGRRQSRQDDG